MPGVPHSGPIQACYFITTVTAGRRKLFTDPQNCQLLANLIYNMRRQAKFLLAGFVIMPDHLHLAVLPTGQSSSEIARDLKKGSARLINMTSSAAGSVWQPEYWDRVIEREDELMQKLQYMEANPYRAHLVAVDDVYPWGTSNPCFETDLERILGG